MRQFVFGFIFLACCSGLACQQRVNASPETVTAPEVTGAANKDSNAQPPPQRAALKLPLKNPLIVVTKSKRRLELYSDGALVRTYKIGLGLNPIPDKIRQGDHATPEGDFYIFTKNDKSAFYLSLGISYPNIEDAERGLRAKIITRAQYDAIVTAIKRKAMPPQNTRLGGDIYIHGNGAGSDGTWGCVALENDEMKELFDALAVGTNVTIKP